MRFHGLVYQKRQVFDMNTGQAFRYEEQQSPHTIKKAAEALQYH